MVFVVNRGVAQARAVQTGMSDGTRTQVTAGLRTGEQVVTAGAQTLQDGAKVAVQQSRG